MATALVLAFKTTDGKTCNIKISNPRVDVTRAEAETVMNDIIDQDVFETASGASLAEIEGVYTVVTTKNEVLV